MSKQQVRLYPGDIERMPWASADGVLEKVVTADDRGSITRYWKLEPGGVAPAGADARWRETYVLEGRFEEAGVAYGAGSYQCLPPGTPRGELSSDSGALCLEICDHNARLRKPEARLTAEAVEALPWQPAASGQTGFVEKFLARDDDGSLTRLLRVELGGDTTELDDHDHDEEVVIVEGSCRNGDELHPAGTYTFNPPHALHGPFLIYEPLLCFEVKNMPDGQASG